jgi:transcriptional regulator
MAALIVNEIASFSQTQIVNVLNAQIHDAMLNNRLSETQENPMFAADEEASLKDNLA